MPHTRPGRKGFPAAVPRGRPFVKMHGLRNHFAIVDAREQAFRPAADELARLCDVQVGIGADQLVVVEPPSEDARAAGAVAFARFWNTDGREAEACGNATRCVAWLLFEESGASAAAVETRAGVLSCRRAGRDRVRTTMGRVSMEWRDVPLAEPRDTVHLDFRCGPLSDPAALSVGNPHLVFFVDDFEAIDLAKLAPQIQRDPLFPQQVNVGVAQMLAHDELRLAVYERGAGLTMACGSGACAAAYAALARGLTDARSLAVQLPGGRLDVEITPDGTAAITGPVAWCYAGWLPAPGGGGS